MIGNTNAQTNAINGDGTSAVEVSKNTFFNSDSIVEIDANNNTKTTVFNSDGSISEKTKNSEGNVILSKTTVFNSDGSISEVVQ